MRFCDWTSMVHTTQITLSKQVHAAKLVAFFQIFWICHYDIDILDIYGPEMLWCTHTQTFIRTYCTYTHFRLLTTIYYNAIGQHLFTNPELLHQHGLQPCLNFQSFCFAYNLWIEVRCSLCPFSKYYWSKCLFC